MTTSRHCTFTKWLTRGTMAGSEGRQGARRGQYEKTGLSSDWSLQLDSMKSESLVVADLHAEVKAFPGLVPTARHTMGVSSTRSGCANPQGRQVPKEWLVTGVKS